ncbi:hypothetical protein DP815_21620 [Salmonella enterica subsp. enterica serovar Mikawasima]|nr:hypothetical protein [Salmonella enterica subsp. enterica serovar Altona]EBW6887647.1 hypothetical protein [Salmonella enterica subsp. enterica serovar Mikawasima]EDI2932949.1 hypothetical protein [Salmonella enterica subsp. enterica serovar Infantis]
MPVVWHCGFNGIINNTMNIGQAGLFINTNDTTSVSHTLSNDNLINNIFGRGNGTQNGGLLPLINYYGRKWSSSSGYGSSYVFGRVKPSFFDNSVPCLSSEQSQPANQSDWFGGWQFRIDLCWPSAERLTTSWRMGFRIGRATHPTYQIPSQVFVCPAAINEANAQNLYAISVVAGQNEKYMEVEWIADTKTLNIYQDDELVSSRTNYTANDMSFGIILMCEHYVGGNTSSTPFFGFELRDMYIQKIVSDADQRLGSSTKVYAFNPVTDDVVQFSRPDGYSSNAAVAVTPIANGGVTPIPSVTAAILGADVVGQQDLYNIDISKVSSRLASVEAVNVRTMARNPLLGSRRVAAIAKSGATQTQSENTSTLEQGGLWRFNTLQMVSDPADGSRWNLTKLAGLKVGTKFVA